MFPLDPELLLVKCPQCDGYYVLPDSYDACPLCQARGKVPHWVANDYRMRQRANEMRLFREVREAGR